MELAESSYRYLFDLNLDPIVILDPGGRFLRANRAGLDFLASQMEDAGGLDLAWLGIRDEEFPQLVQRAVKDGAVIWEFDAAAQGRVLEARLTYLADYGAGGSAFLWVGHDITARVELERTRQQLVHMIVHDLRVPLGNVLNSLDLVLTAWREHDVTMPVEQILEIGLRSANKMEQLVSDILDSARLQARKRALTVAEIDVRKMVAETVETVADAAGRRHQSVSVSVQDDLPLLEGDPDLLGRVLVNLLSNAVKYVQDGGRILLSVRTEAECFQFTVSDDGPGIPVEDQDYIFELFSRGNSQRVKGAGIGLAFCKLAVNAHGGRIWLESEPGKGAAFSFTIPRVLPKSAVYYQETPA